MIPRSKPDHIHWSFGSKPYSHFIAAQSMDFKYWYSPAANRGRCYSFREEVTNACKELDRKRNGKPIALCHGGGVDSEAIALTLQELGIPFELYFLDIWGLNSPILDEHQPELETKLGKKVRRIRASRAHFFETFSPGLFLEFGVEYPTYLLLAYLFEQIPASEFIVTGEGKLERRGALFEKIFRNAGPSPKSEEPLLPITTASTLFYSWAEKRKREGEFYFFNSTPQLLASVIKDPLFQVSPKGADTKEILHHHFPEIRRRNASTNWENDAYKENQNIRSNLCVVAEDLPGWKREASSLVPTSGLFT